MLILPPNIPHCLTMFYLFVCFKVTLGHHIIGCFTFKWKFFAFFSFTFYNKTFLYTNFTVSKIYLMYNFYKVPIFFVNWRALSSEH